MNREEFETRIGQLYDKNFNDGAIDEEGVLKENEELKLETYPYIGENFGEVEPKILFVGQDVGKAEADGRTQSIGERRNNIIRRLNHAIDDENKEFDVPDCEISGSKEVEISGSNEHIPGTFFHAFYLLEKKSPRLSFEPSYGEGSNAKSFRGALKNWELPENEKNPLSYVALTNLYKFVLPEKSQTRETEDLVTESFLGFQFNLLYDEIKKLEPDIIVFQGSDFEPLVVPPKLFPEAEVKQGHHPAARNKNPEDFFKEDTEDARYRTLGSGID